jgi:hypothetical protein
MATMDIKKRRLPAAANKPMVAEETTLPSEAGKKFGSRLNRPKAIIIIVVVLVLFAGFISFRYIQAERRLNQLGNSSQQNAATTTQKIIAKVGQLALLPKRQVPTVAIIKNVSELKNQSFFADAQNGDYVLVYTQSKNAILYRPSINRIVEYANTD